MSKRYCHTCGLMVSDHDVMGAYWIPGGPCKRVGCDAMFNIEKERSEWRKAIAEASDHRGPERAICAVCGEEIGAYESRQYGKTGAVHVWKPDAVAEPAHCYRQENKHLYPFHYTDG